jgi:hypothetical protein
MACVHNLCGNQACRSATMPFQDEVLCERWLILLGRSGDKDWFTHKKGKPKLKEGVLFSLLRPLISMLRSFICFCVICVYFDYFLTF